MTGKSVWYFYKVKWGAQEEFLALFRKNHYPVLKAQLGGRITAIRPLVPVYHGDGRADWTFVMELTFRDTAALVGPSGEDENRTPAVSRSGDVQARGAAPLRARGRPLGRAGDRRGDGLSAEQPDCVGAALPAVPDRLRSASVRRARSQRP